MWASELLSALAGSLVLLVGSKRLDRRENVLRVAFDLHGRPHVRDLAVRADKERAPLRGNSENLPGAVRVDDPLVGIGDERELEVERVDEAFLDLGLVGADADDGRAQRVELRLPSLEVLRLMRSTGCVRTREEPDDRVATEMLGQVEGLAGRGARIDRRRRLADLGQLGWVHECLRLVGLSCMYRIRESGRPGGTFAPKMARTAASR
jgi:hypothetical protein